MTIKHVDEIEYMDGPFCKIIDTALNQESLYNIEDNKYLRIFHFNSLIRQKG